MIDDLFSQLGIKDLLKRLLIIWSNSDGLKASWYDGKMCIDI